jgi:hypothetical protein
MPENEQDAVIMMQHAINHHIDNAEVVFVIGLAISDVTIDAINRGINVDPLAGA